MTMGWTTKNAVTDFPARLHHRTPSWVDGDALFHIRIRQIAGDAAPLTDPGIAPRLLAAAAHYQGTGRWKCTLFLLMPDHLHALVQVAPQPGLATVVRNWKRATYRLVGIRWQTNFFDHRLRDNREAMNKWRYIRRNPVVKGLCAHEDDWPHVICGAAW